MRTTGDSTHIGKRQEGRVQGKERRGQKRQRDKLGDTVCAEHGGCPWPVGIQWRGIKHRGKAASTRTPSATG